MFEIGVIFAQVLLPILVPLSLGFTFRRYMTIDLASINRLCIYVLSPVLIFNTLWRIDVDGGDSLRMFGVVVLFSISMALVTLLVARSMRLERADQSAMLLTTMFMNTGNYGLPLAHFAFGDAGFQYAVLYYIGQSILVQTVAVFIAATGQANIKDSLKKVFQMPLVYAAISGLVLRFTVGIPGPETSFVLAGLADGAELVAGATLPVLLIMLGIQMAAGVKVVDRSRVTIASTLRLVVAAPIAYGIAVMLGLGAMATSVAVIQASMPTAVNVTILASEFNVRPQFVSSVVVVTTLGSLVSLVVLLGIFR